MTTATYDHKAWRKTPSSDAIAEAKAKLRDEVQRCDAEGDAERAHRLHMAYMDLAGRHAA